MIPGISASGRFDPVVRSYRDSLIANSGTISAASLDAVNRFVRAIRVDGLLTDCRALWLMAGSNSAAIRTPLIGTVSVNGSYSTESETGGMQPASLSSANYADLGVNLNGNTQLTLAVDVLARGVGVGTFMSATIGQNNNNTHLLVTAAGAIGFAIRNFPVNLLTSTESPTGVIVGTYDGTTKRIYRNGTDVANHTNEAGNTVVDATFRGWQENRGANSSGLADRLSDDRIGMFGIWGTGLSGTQVSTLQSALATFKTTIGRS